MNIGRALVFGLSAGSLLVLVPTRPFVPAYLFWGIGIPALIGVVWCIWLEYLDSRKAAAEEVAWQERYQALVEVNDLDEPDENVYNWFDSKQWEAIFSELERIPKGSRSLRTAVRKVHPKFLGDG